MKPSAPIVRRAARGFTLIELVLATAIAAIVLLAVQTVFFGALRLRNSTTDKIEADLPVQRTLGIIERDLAGIMLPGGVLTGQLQTTPTTSFTQDNAGERVSPDFFTSSGRVDNRTPFGDVQKVAYFLAPAADGGSGKSLVRVVTRNLLPVMEEETEEQVLLSGVEDAGFEYYDGTAWTDVWDSEATSTLPTAIRFRLLIAGSEKDPASATPIETVVPIVVTTTTSQTEALAETPESQP